MPSSETHCEGKKKVILIQFSNTIRTIFFQQKLVEYLIKLQGTKSCILTRLSKEDYHPRCIPELNLFPQFPALINKSSKQQCFTPEN